MGVIVAKADFNNDGKMDIATANGTSNDVSILNGNGLGAFAAGVNYSVANHPYLLVVGDFNNNNGVDLFVVSNTLNIPSKP